MSVPWCPVCVLGKAADDSHRRRQNARHSGQDVASFDNCDISAVVSMFTKTWRVGVQSQVSK